MHNIFSKRNLLHLVYFLGNVLRLLLKMLKHQINPDLLGQS